MIAKYRRYRYLVSILGYRKWYRYLSQVSELGIEKYRYLGEVSELGIEKYRYLGEVSNTKYFYALYKYFAMCRSNSQNQSQEGNIKTVGMSTFFPLPIWWDGGDTLCLSVKTCGLEDH